MAALSFQLDDSAFTDLVADYEERRGQEAVAGLHRVSITQRADAISVIGALNQEGGWWAEPEDTSEQVFLRHLAPVLAETRSMRELLKDVLLQRGVPGAFSPELSSTQRSPKTAAKIPAPPPRWLMELVVWLRGLSWFDWAGLVISAVLLLAPLWLTLLPTRSVLACGTEGAAACGPGITDPIVIRPPPPAVDLPPAVVITGVDEIPPVLDAVLSAASLPPQDMTPAHLAAHLAGRRIPSGDPALYLDAMLDRYPLMPDAAVPHDANGGLALINWAAAVAALEGDVVQSTEITGMLFADNDKDAAEGILVAVLPQLDPRLAAFMTGIGSGTHTSRNEVLVPWSAVLDWAPLLIPCFFLIWAILDWRGAVELRSRQPPALPRPGLSLLVPGAGRKALAIPAAARAMAAALRYVRVDLAGSLDVERTLGRGLARGGLFQPVRRQRPVTVRHLFLIRRRTLDEHEPRRIADWLSGLIAAGAEGEIYEYSNDPGLVRPFGQMGQAAVDLASLTDSSTAVRLFLFTSGEEIAGPLSPGLTPDQRAVLHIWPMRAVFTSRPTGDWGLREYAISRTLSAPVAHFGSNGPSAVLHWYGPAAAASPRNTALGNLWTWLAAQRSEPGDESLSPPLPLHDLVRSSRPEDLPPGVIAASLTEWLGPRGFVWLAACASYPVLRYPLTVWLGGQLQLSETELRLRLAQLCRLPWFNVGSMPDWVRQELINALPRAEQDLIDAAFATFFRLKETADLPPITHVLWSADSNHVQVEFAPQLTGRERVRKAYETLVPPPEAPEVVRRRARWAVLLRRGAALMAAIYLAIILQLIWPDRMNLPLPPGAWVPVVGTLSVALTTVVIVAVRSWRRNPQ